MQDRWAIGGVSRDDDSPPAVEPAGPLTSARPSRAPTVLIFVVGLVAVAAIAAAAWVYTETQRDMRRMAADIAQIKLSLELFGRQQTSAVAPTDGGVDAATLEALENRLAILEESWRSGSIPTPVSAPTDAPVTDTASGPLTDCMPQDTRMLVTAGDDYAVCGSEARVIVSGVGQSEITFAGDEAIVVGGSMALDGTSCIVAVLSANADGLSGYGEVRVRC